MEPLIVWMVLNAAIAVALGAVPFILARVKGATKFGVSAWVLIVLAGLLVGLLASLPIAVVLSGIAARCSPERLKSLGESEAGGGKDAAIVAVFILLAIGMLVTLAIQFDAIG